MQPPLNALVATVIAARRGLARRFLVWSLLVGTVIVVAWPLPAQPTPLAGAAELKETLDRLNTLGSMLILGAHPDDENTAVIAYFARGRHVRTAYLAATRGEGGQNLIGPEQGTLMGVIRTQELLAARRIDGGEQFFTRAIDFGYSKSAEEALAKWGRERVLGDMVRIIRRFRPDVLVTRFGPDGSGGHGHHSAVGVLAPEAFQAAADPHRFPEQIKQGFHLWQAKRLYWNTYSFTPGMERHEAARSDRLRIDVGQYDPVLGRSYAEVAGESRSMHRSQAMGSRQRKGSVPAFFAYIAGERAEQDLFDGIDTSWNRIPGGNDVGRLLEQARREYQREDPAALVPLLLESYRKLQKLNHPWARFKETELLRAIELAAGLWLDAAADNWFATPGSQIKLTLSALNRSKVPLSWSGAEINGASPDAELGSAKLRENEVAEKRLSIGIPSDALFSQPDWLRPSEQGAFYDVQDPEIIGRAESRPVLTAVFHLESEDGTKLAFEKPVVYRWVDRSVGERTRAFQIVPPVAAEFAAPNMIFPDTHSRPVSVRLQSNTDKAHGTVSLQAPPNWTVSPVSQSFEVCRAGQQIVLDFELQPPADDSQGIVVAEITVGSKVLSTGMQAIEYPHFPIQVVYPKAEMRVARANVKLLSKNIGYIMGAGDDVPEALEQIGASVTLLSAQDLVSLDLTRFDAIVTGIRVLDTRPELRAAQERLLDYVELGGTLVVQYNTVSRRAPTPALAPYPLQPSRQRVSVEDAGVTFLLPDHPLLQAPNRITPEDFDGWVQERGLYFMGEWDERYEAPLACSDPDEPPLPGGLLYARYGEGVYIFTAYSWFRQLPAGVPGAYRIFANLVSAGKVAAGR